MRRIVTGHSTDGRSVFLSHGEPSRIVALKNRPGFKMTEIWMTEGIPEIPAGNSDPTVDMNLFTPDPGGTRFRIVRFPPACEYNETDPEAVRKEYIAKAPGLGDSLEPENPGMHTTDTVDYGIVISGEIWLELDDGEEVHLRSGDCVVQNGTRHAWRNRGMEACVMAFVMVGAKRAA